jgi:hypothetical protein
LLAPQNKILAGFSNREAGAAVYMHAMKTKPHSYLDLLSKMKTRLAAYRLDPFAVDRRGVSRPQAQEKDVHFDHLARRRHTDGVQIWAPAIA